MCNIIMKGLKVKTISTKIRKMKIILIPKKITIRMKNMMKKKKKSIKIRIRKNKKVVNR